MITGKKTIRLATMEDSCWLLGIYAPYIYNTAVTFECDVPTVEEFSERIKKISGVYPWLVCEINDCIAGYAYASQHSERSAYQWSVNLSVYIKNEYQKKGLANALYITLFELLKLLGYFNAYAGITLPNIKSERFHESLRFKPVGVYHHVGYKLGEWHDVIWYQRDLKDLSEAPFKPMPIKDVDSTIINAILKRNSDLIKIW